ncbi:uncharacterized protein [Henckelia pumila]|uniref:uncharacterized protein n=1 Tax=Henckelia pumila TaxID=405737 RepID=UPI003C6E886E
MENCIVATTPMGASIKLDKDEGGIPVDATMYQGLIGSLLYLTASRPDIVFAQNQFRGEATEDPNLHLRTFLEIADTVKIHGVTEDTIRLRLFSFSLRYNARSWLQSLPLGSITTWEDMTSKFLAKYFPFAKSAQLKIEITTFKQQDHKLLYESWEHYKEFLRKGPNQNFPDWEQIELFYNGLNGPTRLSVDAATGGSIFSKFPADAYEMLEQMTINSYQWLNERSAIRKPAGIHELAALTKGNKVSIKTASLATFVNSPDDEGRSSLEDLVGNFISESTKRFERTENKLDNMEIHLTNVGASMKNLEIQIGQLANALMNQQRGSFPSNTEVNPREQCKVVIFRSDKELGTDKPKAVDDEEVEEIVVESEKSDSQNSSKSAVVPEKPPVPKMPHYAKFMKDVMARKRKLKEFETVKSLELGEVKPTTITVQLADRSLTYPRGVVEDVLVKVDKLIFSADFVVFDMEEDQDVPLILGRPFLATGRALIDVQEGELTLRVGGEAVTFNIYKTTNYQDKVRACNHIDLFDSSVNNFGVGIELKSGRNPKVAKKVKNKAKSKMIFEYVWRVKERNKTSSKVTGIG